jgi:hypothetical protein
MRTDADSLLAARFAATNDPHDSSDWNDVVARKGPSLARRRRTLVVAIALIAILVPTALAFGGAIRNLFSAGHYSVSNHGKEVAKRGHTNWFNGHGYKLFFLGTAGSSAFYRAEVTPHFKCWGRGPANAIGQVGTLGCPGVVGAYPIQSDDEVVDLRRGTRTPTYSRIDGVVVDQAESVALVDERGKQIAKATVKDNLYAFSPPFPKGFLRLVALDVDGKPLVPHPEWGQHQSAPPKMIGPRATEVTPAQLKDVMQRGTGEGVGVTVGANGVVDFDASSIASATEARLAGRNASFNCFAITGNNVRKARTAGIGAMWKTHVTVKMTGYLKPPFDGCTIGGHAGHSWHDRFGTHSEVEVALTQRGHRYFEDRAAARDLAEFVRSKTTQGVRRRTGASLVAAVKATYGNQVDILASADARAPAGRVGVFVSGTTTVFSEQSTVGVRFYVEFKNGERASDNVRGLALVF